MRGPPPRGVCAALGGAARLRGVQPSGGVSSGLGAVKMPRGEVKRRLGDRVNTAGVGVLLRGSLPRARRGGPGGSQGSGSADPQLLLFHCLVYAATAFAA